MATLMSDVTEPNTSRLTVELRIAEQRLPFRLYTRPLDLGDGLTVQYYWMHTGRLRDLRTPEGRANYDRCVRYWVTDVSARGQGDDPVLQGQVALALAYPDLCRAKGMQRAYRDAYLRPRKANNDGDALPDDEREEIRRVVTLRDWSRVAAELDRTLGRFEPLPSDAPRLREAFHRWLVNGAVAVRSEEPDALDRHLADVRRWVASYRKRSPELVRAFIDLYAYTAKVNFNACYAAAWSGLIPWLRRNRGLDPVSEHFLWYWHSQSQSVVFPGQVLALHPLSGIFMAEPALLARAGRYFGMSLHYEPAMRAMAESTSEHWGLVEAVLIAARLYRRALDRQSQHPCRAGKRAPAGDVDGDALGRLERFVASRGFVCPSGHGPLSPTLGKSDHPSSDQFTVVGVCPVCRETRTCTYSRAELCEFLGESAD